jgi:hypothetical protein
MLMALTPQRLKDTKSALAVQPITTAADAVLHPSGTVAGALIVTTVDSAGAPTGTASALPSGTDRSGTIAAGGTAQALAAANTARTFLVGQNTSSGDLWLNEIGGTAAANGAGSYRVASGATFSVNTSRAISIIGAVTGQAFAATEG